jgi:hypothetical protein
VTVGVQNETSERSVELKCTVTVALQTETSELSVQLKCTVTVGLQAETSELTVQIQNCRSRSLPSYLSTFWSEIKIKSVNLLHQVISKHLLSFH